MSDKIESLSSIVHEAWMKEKIKQGFHAPLSCPFISKSCQGKFDKICAKCHTDLYSYNELPENIKDYDRATVKAVLKAIEELKGN